MFFFSDQLTASQESRARSQETRTAALIAAPHLGQLPGSKDDALATATKNHQINDEK